MENKSVVTDNRVRHTNESETEHDSTVGKKNTGHSGGSTRWVAASSYLRTGLRILKGLVLPKLLSPTLYGLYTSLNIFRRYGKYADLGIAQLLAKRLPSTLATEGESGYERELGEALAWGLVTTALVAIGLIGAAWWQEGPHAWFYRVALPITAVVIVGQKVHRLLGRVTRAREWFRVHSIVEFTFALLGTGAAIGLLVVFGVLGLVWSLLIAEVVAIGFYLVYVRCPRLRIIPIRRIKATIAGSTTLLLLEVTKLLLGSIDKVFVLIFLSKENLGLYSLGWFVASSAMGVAGIYVTIIHPKMMRLIKGESRARARRIVNRALTAYGVVLVTATPLGYPILYLFVNSYLPEYAQALPLYFLFPFVALFKGTTHIFYPYFVAKDEELNVISWSGISILSTIVLMAFSHFYWGSLVPVLLSIVSGQFILCAFMLYSFEGDWGGRLEWSKYSLFGLQIVICTLFYFGLGYLSMLDGPYNSLFILGVLPLSSVTLSFLVLWAHISFVKESISYFWR